MTGMGRGMKAYLPQNTGQNKEGNRNVNMMGMMKIMMMVKIIS